MAKERVVMQEMGDEIAKQAQQRLGRPLKVLRVEEGLIFEHRKASHFLAEIDLRSGRFTVPVTAEFLDHPEYDGEELVEHAMELLRPRLEMYRQRGYRLRESEWQPGRDNSTYGEEKVPVFVAYVERRIEDPEEVIDELAWLLERLGDR